MLALLGGILSLAGVIIMLIFFIQILIMAFKKDVLWGLGSLFIPFVALIYVIKYWEETKTPFLRWLIGFGVVVVGSILTIMGAGAQQ